MWGILKKLEQPKNILNASKRGIEYVRNIFSSARGFVVKSNLRDLLNCFWVEPNWEKYEIQQQHLGKQILVCVLEGIDDVEKIYQYLYKQNRRETITEISFVFSDYSKFNSETRKRIRDIFKKKYLRCIFIQKENFKQISDRQGWRKIFYQLLEISKIS